VLSLPLPLTKGKTLGELLPLGELSANKLVFDALNDATRLVDKDGNPQFTSAQNLTTKLAGLLSLTNTQINPTFLDEENGQPANKLMFTVGFDTELDPDFLTELETSDIGFDIDLGEIAGLESEADVKLTPSGKVGFTFGIDLAPGGSNPIFIAPPLVASQLRAVHNSLGNTQTPNNGKLTKTAAFKLTIGGGLGGTINVTVTSAESQVNNSRADLVAMLQSKINAALTANSIDPTPDANDATKLLVKVDTLDDGRLRFSSTFSTFLMVKKLATDTGGFATELGFLENQQASVAPTPANGVLGDDADFQIRLGTDAAIYNVKVTKASTLDNTSIDDLVADINTALGLATPSSLASRVIAERIGGSTGIMLKARLAPTKLLQIVDADNIVEQDFGWQDKHVDAEISAIGANELVVTGTSLGDNFDGKTADDEVVFRFEIDGGDPITVRLRKNAEPNSVTNPNLSNTADNTSISDLVADLNLAIAHAKLPDGRSLGSIISAGAIDTNQDSAATSDGDSFIADTIVFRSTADISTFKIIGGTHSGQIGYLNADQVARHVGPNTASGALPASGATFTLSLGDQTPVSVHVTKAATDDNAAAPDKIAALVNDIQAVIDGTALAGQIVVGRAGDRIVLAATSVGDQRMRINLDLTSVAGKAAGEAARDVLGLRDGLLARADEGIRFFIQDAGVEIGAKVEVENMSASAHLGFVSISIADTSEASLELDLKIQLKDNQNNTTRIFLDELDDRLTDIRHRSGSALATGDLTGNATFKIKLNGTEHLVTVAQDATNNTPADLVADVQAAINTALAGVNARVIASLSEQGVLVLSVSAREAKSFELLDLNAVATGELKLAPALKSSLLVVPTASWSGNVKFDDITIPNAIPGLDAIPPFDIDVTVGNSFPGVATLVPGLGSVPQDLLNFAELLFGGAAGLLEAIEGLSDFLNGKFNDLPFVGTKIPIINMSFADLLNVGDTFKAVVDGFKNNPTSNIQDLKNRLIEALGLPSNDPSNPVQVTYENGVLLLDLTFDKSFNRTLPIDFNNNDLPFAIKGNASLEAEGAAKARLVVGIDLSTPTSPKLFLDTDKTEIDLSFAARGKGLNFTASFGPAGLFISDGMLAIDADGLATTDTDPISFKISLDDTDAGNPNDGRLSFGDITSITATTNNIVGAMNATLPIFFPSDSDFLGNLGMSIADIETFLGGDFSTGVDIQVPDLSNILTNLDFNLLDNLPLLIDGVDFILGQLQTLLDKHLGSLNLPVIGDGLHDAAQFINKIRNDVFQTLKQKFLGALQSSDQIITDALFDVFENKLGILTSAIDVEKSLEGTTDDFVEWRFSLGQPLTIDVPFDLGLPVLGLKSTSPMQLNLDWALNMGFGLNFDKGFYFIIDDDASNPEMSVNASVDLPDIEGNLLFLKITGKDNHDGPDLTAAFELDITGPSEKVGITELLDLDFDPSLTGAANINLGLRAGINAGSAVNGKAISALPSILADFKLDAALDLDNANGNSPFSLDYVAFENIGLDLGSFFSDFLKPLISGIQDVTKPLQPFIDVFTSPIPVISDLAGEPITLLDIAGLFGEVDPSMIEAVANIITLVNTIPTNVSNIVIPFGDVVLVGTGNPGADFDLFDDKALDDVRDSNTPLSGLGSFGTAISDFTNGGGFDAAVDGSAASSEVKSFSKGLNGGDFGDFIDFPFLRDPSQILGALFGRPFTLVTLDLPPFAFGFSYSQFFPIIGPLGASITGSLGAKFDFAFGYDSEGLQKFAEGGFKYPLDIFRGFYISDTANADGTGADVNEVEITGALIGAAELNLGVAKGSVGGGVKVTFGLDLNDPNSDGKIRIEELINNIVFSDPPFNPLAIFDLGIKVEAFLTWAVEVLFVFKASGQIGPSLPILDLEIELPKQPVLATEVGDDGNGKNVLRLNMGPFAGDRLRVNVADGNETYVVKQTAANTFEVTAFGFTQTYDNIGRIEAQGGQGNDSITFQGVEVPILVDAGQGDDLIDLSTSSGVGTITLGTGNDTAKGGSAADVILGGDGADLILGGGGADAINGGLGNDSASGDGGNDTIIGDADKDQLAGGADNDFIDGGAGDDKIWGDATFDGAGTFVPATVDGADIISGGLDKDELHGDGGNDTIGGGAAADLIEGNLGVDEIWGDSTYDAAGTRSGALPMTEGGDRIYGDSATAALTGAGTDGGDLIHGEAGNDFIRGNSGNDDIFGDDGADLLFGDQNNDEIEGGEGGDIAFGGADNDTVRGQASSDILFGDDGLVVYFGFPNFTGYAGDQIVAGNRLIGDGAASQVAEFTGTPDTDALSRDLFITDVRSTDGDDYVDGAAGNDVEFGGKGNDTIIGDFDPTAANFDAATAPTGNDIMFGDGGKVQYFDRITTVAATIDPSDDGGNDTTYGNNGDDVQFGGPGADNMNGGHGAGAVTTASDKDVLIGDNGQVDFVGGKISEIKSTDGTNDEGGIDNISGDEDRDVIIGGVKGDNLDGKTASDIILGDEGQLFYNLSGPGLDGDITTVDKIETTNFTLGGDDNINGAGDSDIAMGGTGADTITGDSTASNPGNDTLIGDQGKVDLFEGDVTRIITTDVIDADGGIDNIDGNDGDDAILGGVQGDNLHGNNGADIILGDEGQLQFNLTGVNRDGDVNTVDNIETLQPNLGGNDIIEGNAGADRAFGGADDDFVYGDADAPLAANDGGDMLFGDGGRASLLNNVVWKLESTDTAIGGVDYMEGNAGNDIMLGGVKGDEMHGDAGNGTDINATLDGNDTMLGDNGELNWLYTGNAALSNTLENGFTFDSNIGTLDVITTTAPNDGGADKMFGNAGSDNMFGGTAADLLVGDNTKGTAPGIEFGAASDRAGEDLQFGDHGRIYPQHSFLADFPSRNFFSIDIGFTSGGAGDRIFGNEQDDIQIGGQGDDQMFGNSGDDDMIGGHNVSTVTGAETAIDEFKKPDGLAINDFMDGGTGDDAMAGDNAKIWRNGATLQANDLRLRIRTLNGSLLFKADGTPNITGAGHNDPLTSTTRSMFLLDHTLAIQTADFSSLVGSRYGNDLMAGGADDDVMFGQLGGDFVQGDGRIDEATVTVEIYEGVRPDGTITDGHDYIEGNGGTDMLIGNLGQDDIIGGSSQFFGLTTGAMRPDDSDVIFGGAANPARVERHAFTGDVQGDNITFGGTLANRHAVDSDFIMGDNANIYRIVDDAGGVTSFKQFNYDQTSSFENRGNVRIVVRASEKLDYSPIETVTTSIGARDIIRGESGDDFIHGMTGEDLLYGDAENDEIFGERDRDWLSGGTGDDAMLGDNGLVLTSRNSIAEPLYGVVATTQQFLATPGDFLQTLLNPNGVLKHAVDLEPFDQGADDVMYGGLGDDHMHGGEGNDGISGAEALPEFYNSPETTKRVEVGDILEDRSKGATAEIRILPRDGNGVIKIGFYDFVNALPKLANHFLNFENDLSLQTTIGSHFDIARGDGRDVIFGDWGHDWIVGGSGRDHMFGGMGNDILNLDDDLETTGGTNSQPDNGVLVAGDAGGPAQVYNNADTAYGGGGRDLLIGNTGADRAEDWVGEFNSFVAPFAPFGNGHVERQVPPSTYEFFYALGESDGADQTRTGSLTAPAGGAVGDPLRRGEPYGELGLVTQQDKLPKFDWASQNGAPIDRQAGNTPGGMRDTRGDGLNGGTTNTTAITTATTINDLTLVQVIENVFSYWAQAVTFLNNVTLVLSISDDAILENEALAYSLIFDALFVADEYYWITEPIV
jgi:Ca2+-binding RTX toxin-like protein